MSSHYYDAPGIFFAHALALEQEAAERLGEAAQMMQVHNNNALVTLFQELASYSMEHENEIRALARGVQLPELKPWEYDWPGAEAPETGDSGKLHYLMRERQALELVLDSEKNAHDFYILAAEKTHDEAVRKYAQLFAEEEAKHVELLKARLLQSADDERDDLEDLDPPNMPD